MNKAHIQHTVGFIQHQHFNFVQAHGVLMFKIQQAAGRCHQDIDAAAQLHHLRVNAHAAEHHQRTNVKVFAVIPHVLANLRRQLTGRGQDQRAHRTTAFSVRFFLDQVLKQRQRKSRRFTSTGLGAGHQIATL